MPDWVSHILIGLILCELLELRPKSLVLFGTLLPDLILKLELLHLFFPVGDKIFWFFMPFHTPIGLILATFILLLFFKYNRKKSFMLISIGWISHLLSDMLTQHYLIRSFLLFPFSWKSFEFGLIWPEEFLLILFPLIIIYILIFVTKKYAAYKQMIYP